VGEVRIGELIIGSELIKDVAAEINVTPVIRYSLIVVALFALSIIFPKNI
jgi:hypothetical protein